MSRETRAIARLDRALHRLTHAERNRALRYVVDRYGDGYRPEPRISDLFAPREAHPSQGVQP